MDTNFFAGLFFYEFILLLLGAVLFLALVVLLILKGVRQQPLKGLIPFFILPVIMIGYPSIEQITFIKDFAVIKKIMAENPDVIDDEQTKELLDSKMESVANRASRIRNPEEVLVLARANEMLGNTEEARNMSEVVLQQQPENTEAVRIRSRAEIQENIELLTRTQDNQHAINEIERNIAILEGTSQKSSRDLLFLSKGNASIGNETEARSYYEAATTENPRLLRERINIP